jgi:Cu2+-exporting ATPase
MKTSVIEVHDMLSVLTVDEVEKRIGKVPGVASATVNFAAGNATVRYDETLLEVADIKVLMHQHGQQPAGESQAKDVSEHKPEHKLTVKPTPEAALAPASTPEATVPKAAPVAPATAPKLAAPAGGGPQDKEVPAAPPSTQVAAKEE